MDIAAAAVAVVVAAAAAASAAAAVAAAVAGVGKKERATAFAGSGVDVKELTSVSPWPAVPMAVESRWEGTEDTAELGAPAPPQVSSAMENLLLGPNRLEVHQRMWGEHLSTPWGPQADQTASSSPPLQDRPAPDCT